LENGKKIFFLGFMGSGKTTLGKRLANKLNIPFFDLDAEIEKVTFKCISVLFEEEGEAFFRKCENKVLKAFIANNENFVLSLGGGTPCHNNNINQINHAGTSIYLKHNVGILTSRLINSKVKRPLIEGLNKQELIRFIKDKLKEREDYYNQSKYIIEGNNIKVEDLIILLQ
jgi:shikimate kinase